MSESTDATRCWVVSPMLNDTESFVRLRTETTDACHGRRPRTSISATS